MNWRDKPFITGMLDQRQEWRKVASHIEQTDGFLVDSKLRPGYNLKEFVECTKSSRQGNERVSQA
jgi:hypothetical protein